MLDNFPLEDINQRTLCPDLPYCGMAILYSILYTWFLHRLLCLCILTPPQILLVHSQRMTVHGSVCSRVEAAAGNGRISSKNGGRVTFLTSSHKVHSSPVHCEASQGAAEISNSTLNHSSPSMTDRAFQISTQIISFFPRGFLRSSRGRRSSQLGLSWVIRDTWVAGRRFGISASDCTP